MSHDGSWAASGCCRRLIVTGLHRPCRSRVAYVQGAFPSSVWYATARPTALLLERDVEVYVIAQGPTRGQGVVDGVTIWYEPSLRHAAERLVRLRPELTFFEGVGRELALLPVCHRRWVRSPHHSAHLGKAAAEQALILLAHGVTFTNPYDAARWTVPAVRRLDLPYPVDVGFWSKRVERDPRWWERRGWPVPTGPVIAYVSNILRRKRQAELTAALAPLLRRRPDSMLVIAGRTFDTEERDSIAAIIRDESLSAQVWLTGELDQDEMRQLYSWTDVHAVNTTYETQCMAVFESLAAGVPTVIPALPVLSSAFPALLTHRNDSELRTNVERLLDDRSLGDEQIARSMGRVEWADVRRHDRLFLEHYDRLVA